MANIFICYSLINFKIRRWEGCLRVENLLNFYLLCILALCLYHCTLKKRRAEGKELVHGMWSEFLLNLQDQFSPNRKKRDKHIMKHRGQSLGWNFCAQTKNYFSALETAITTRRGEAFFLTVYLAQDKRKRCV